MTSCFFFQKLSQRDWNLYGRNFTGDCFTNYKQCATRYFCILPESLSVSFCSRPTHHPHIGVHIRASRLYHTNTHVFLYPRIAADACEQCVQDGVVIVTMQQDEAQEGFEEGSLGHAAEEKIQVGGAGDHLIHRWLQTHTYTEIGIETAKQGSVTTVLWIRSSLRLKTGSETISTGHFFALTHTVSHLLKKVQETNQCMQLFKVSSEFNSHTQ